MIRIFIGHLTCVIQMCFGHCGVKSLVSCFYIMHVALPAQYVGNQTLSFCALSILTLHNTLICNVNIEASTCMFQIML